jgi:hypothetical protein
MKFWETLLLSLISWVFSGGGQTQRRQRKIRQPFLYKSRTLEENILGYVEFFQVLKVLGLEAGNMIDQAESHSCTFFTNVAWSRPSTSR